MLKTTVPSNGQSGLWNKANLVLNISKHHFGLVSRTFMSFGLECTNCSSPKIVLCLFVQKHYLISYGPFESTVILSVLYSMMHIICNRLVSILQPNSGWLPKDNSKVWKRTLKLLYMHAYFALIVQQAYLLGRLRIKLHYFLKENIATNRTPLYQRIHIAYFTWRIQFCDHWCTISPWKVPCENPQLCGVQHPLQEIS